MTDVASTALRAVPTLPDARGNLRTVLIFAYECAPFNRNESTIGAQRPAQFAKYLPQFGWRAIVLCCDAAKRHEGWTTGDRDAVLAAIRDADPSSSLIIATSSLPWDGPLDRAWRGVARQSGAPVKALIRKPLTFAKFFTGDYSQSWQPCAREAAELIAREVPIHACIGEHSPDAGLFLARWFSKRYNVPWVADFRDPMLFGFHPKIRPLLEPFARRMLSSASHVVNVTPRCVELDKELFERPTSLITNGFDPEQFAGPAPERSRQELRIVYTGSVWLPGSLRVFFDGLSELRTRIGNARFKRVRFVYRGGSLALVGKLAADADITDVLDGAAHVPHALALSLVRSAHLLLVLSTSKVEHRDPYWSQGVYPGKTFEYIGSQRPILCAPGDGGSLDALLRETGAGTTLESAESVATYLEATFAQWERVGDLPALDNAQHIARYSRRTGAQKIAAILDQLGLGAPVSIGNDAQELRVGGAVV